MKLVEEIKIYEKIQTDLGESQLTAEYLTKFDNVVHQNPDYPKIKSIS